MGTELLIAPEFRSMCAQSALLEGEPVMDWVDESVVPGVWVAVHGWVMPWCQFRLMHMWCMLGSKAYFNRVDHDAWDAILKKVNSHKVIPKKAHSQHMSEIIWSDVNSWYSNHVQGDLMTLNTWFQDLIHQHDQLRELHMK